eukprot:SAG31_NODE_3973_length_3702_cov_3.586848_4_plen_150_part_00
MFFSTKRRPALVEQFPDWSFGEYGKKIGTEWAAMNESKRAPYQKKADKDKLRYQKEMQNYEPPSDDDEPAGRKKKAKKDPNAPKRACSAFMFYSIERRPQLKDEHPDWSFGAFGKQIGTEWRSMSDGEKAPYEHQAEQDKIRYAREMGR